MLCKKENLYTVLVDIYIHLLLLLEPLCILVAYGVFLECHF